MRHAHDTATLLARASSRRGLDELARALGFTDPLDIDDALGASLGIAELTREASLATGAGMLRALLVQTNGTGSSRESAATIAAQLARATPHLLWMLLLRRRGSPEVVLATWTAERGRPKLSALVIDTRAVLPSDVDAVKALAAAGGEHDVLTHARWLDALGRESLTQRFYRTLERLVGDLVRNARGTATEEERAELAVLCVSRLLFLCFVQTKGWLDSDPSFLERTFTNCMLQGGSYQRRVLFPLFFGTLNTPPEKRAAAARRFGRVPFLNGGLFTRTALERMRRDVTFDDDTLGAVFGELLLKYRFTAREENDRWSEAAIDPEMLGRVFESLMVSRDRRSSGAFYTPQSLVTSVTRAALLEALAPGPDALADVERVLNGDPAPRALARPLLDRLRSLTVLDPACGSGAFLVHALEEIADIARRLGDGRPLDVVRRQVLATSIFGVDVNPTAAWLCELRLWLSVVIDNPETDPLCAAPLPNLDHHIRVGDALAGDAFTAARILPGGPAMARLRERYMRATGSRKHALARCLDRHERQVALARIDDVLERCAARRRDLLSALRSRDLFGERVSADATMRDALRAERLLTRGLRAERRTTAGGGALSFSFATHFPDIAARGGFDIIVGNPPWVRLHRIPVVARSRMRRQYQVLTNGTWEHGAALANVSKGFAAQTDLAALFAERALQLLRADGAAALLLPAKLWRSLAGGGVRRVIAERARVVRIEDWSEAPACFDAAVYPSMLVVRGNGPAGDREASPHACRNIAAVVHRGHSRMAWELGHDRLHFDSDAASPWIVAPEPVRAAFEQLRRAGPPLAGSALGPPQLGVKCGCNDAFLVTLLATHGSTATVRAGTSHFHVERSLLRAVVRGEGVVPWMLPPSARRIIWTHGEDGQPLHVLPPRAMSWLSRHRARLRMRADARHGAWWSLFRTAGACADAHRVIWADFGRAPRAAVLPMGDGTVPLNSCYVLRCQRREDALAIATLLNSPLVAAWLRLIAEPARGGYLRYLGWTMSLLPVPADWERAVALLAPLAERARDDPRVDATELLRIACRAYRVRTTSMEPLLAWSAR